MSFDPLWEGVGDLDERGEHVPGILFGVASLLSLGLGKTEGGALFLFSLLLSLLALGLGSRRDLSVLLRSSSWGWSLGGVWAFVVEGGRVALLVSLLGVGVALFRSSRTLSPSSLRFLSSLLGLLVAGGSLGVLFLDLSRTVPDLLPLRIPFLFGFALALLGVFVEHLFPHRWRALEGRARSVFRVVGRNLFLVGLVVGYALLLRNSLWAPLLSFGIGVAILALLLRGISRTLSGPHPGPLASPGRGPHLFNPPRRLDPPMAEAFLRSAQFVEKGIDRKRYGETISKISGIPPSDPRIRSIEELFPPPHPPAVPLPFQALSALLVSFSVGSLVRYLLQPAGEEVAFPLAVLSASAFLLYEPFRDRSLLTPFRVLFFGVPGVVAAAWGVWALIDPRGVSTAPLALVGVAALLSVAALLGFALSLRRKVLSGVALSDESPLEALVRIEGEAILFLLRGGVAFAFLVGLFPPLVLWGGTLLGIPPALQEKVGEASGPLATFIGGLLASRMVLLFQTMSFRKRWESAQSRARSAREESHRALLEAIVGSR